MERVIVRSGGVRLREWKAAGETARPKVVTSVTSIASDWVVMVRLTAEYKGLHWYRPYVLCPWLRGLKLSLPHRNRQFVTYPLSEKRQDLHLYICCLIVPHLRKPANGKTCVCQIIPRPLAVTPSTCWGLPSHPTWPLLQVISKWYIECKKFFVGENW